jgi:hypothetical protein
MLAYSFLMMKSSTSSVLSEEEPSQEVVAEGFSPLSAKTYDAAGDPQAGARVAAGGPGAVVRGDRPDKNLPSAQELTK